MTIEKWADYVITCVTYTADESHIATVGVHVHKGDTLETKATWHRSQVIDALGEGSTFVTGVRNPKGTLSKGAAVERYAMSGKWFIKTAASETKADNLGELPAC